MIHGCLHPHSFPEAVFHRAHDLIHSYCYGLDLPAGPPDQIHDRAHIYYCSDESLADAPFEPPLQSPGGIRDRAYTHCSNDYSHEDPLFNRTAIL